MQFPRLISFARQLLSLALAALLIAPGWAQDTAQSAPNAPSQSTPAQAQSPRSQAFEFSSYSKPRSHFPNPIGPYIPRTVEAPNLSNTPRIDQLMQNGKLMLSLPDAIALALENNLDIAIARYNLNIADTDVLRAKAGAQTLGVNTGIVQTTPGGGVGGIGAQVGTGTGGTTLGAGGAGVGAGGIVQNTAGGLFGPFITSFDPVITGSFQSDHGCC